MLILFRTLVIALLLATPLQAGDPVWGYDASNPEMNAAIEAARATLPVFYEKMEATDLSQEVLLLKVGMPYGNDGHEHIWVAVLGREGDRFDGYFANDPVYIDYKQYDPISFGEESISDWFYYDDAGMIQGAYTIRVMLPELPPEQAEEYRKVLAPLPEAAN